MITRKDFEETLYKHLRFRDAIAHAGAVKIIPLNMFGEDTDNAFLLSFLLDGKPIKQDIEDLLHKRIEGLKESLEQLETTSPHKVFREHRGGLAESLETTIECPNGLSDIKAHYEKTILKFYIQDMHIQENAIHDDRLPVVWGGKSYNVIARSAEDDIEFVIGQCNFRE